MDINTTAIQPTKPVHKPTKRTAKPTRPVGRPPIIKSPDEMAILVDQWIGKMYSETTGAYIGHPTEDHLARYLGFQDRQSLRESGEKPEFTCYIKKALSVISQYHITQACEPGKGHFPIGHIFVAKNMGWSDSMTVNNRNLNINVNSEVSDKQLTDIITGNAGDWL